MSDNLGKSALAASPCYQADVEELAPVQGWEDSDADVCLLCGKVKRKLGLSHQAGFLQAAMRS